MNNKIIGIHPFRARGMTTLLSLFIVLALAPTTMVAVLIDLEATIDEAQANAGNGTGSLATGSATMTFDDQSNVFSWNISWSGLEGNVTVAHFHGPASAGVNAGVEVNIGDISGLNSPSIGSTVISDTQGTDLLAELWYINIHSDRDAVTLGGEIRGQVLQSQVQPSAVPEPSTIALTAFGGLCAMGYARKRKIRRN